MWNVSLSTMWGLGRFPDLGQFFSIAESLGFQCFELNHGVNSEMLRGVDLARYTVTSIHEPCPADVPSATLSTRNWLVSCPQEEGRRQGVLAAQRSIDLAQRLGASIVVVHAGRVDAAAEVEQGLWDLYEAGQAGTAAYTSRKERLVAARAERAPANLEAARRSVTELAEYAASAGIRLGIENRYHYLDIPLPDEMEVLLAAAGQDNAGFLYDVGHAQTLDNLGFVAHEAWLQRFASRMIGAHLHDIRGLEDHFAAGRGEVDWDMVAGYLPAQVPRTLEFRPHNTPAQLQASLEFLAGKGCIARTALA